jgi:hypothetical protein
MLAFIHLVTHLIVSLCITNQSMDACNGTGQLSSPKAGRGRYKSLSRVRLQFAIGRPTELVTRLRFWQPRLFGCSSDG